MLERGWVTEGEREMDDKEMETEKRLMSIFMPYAAGRLQAVRESKKRFVHYSSAENIFKIISSKTMWLRNTRCMADFSEVEHGYAMLLKFFQQPHNKEAFSKAVDSISPNLASESLTLFDQWWADIRFNTYICSISEHEDSEDGHGRLSMWRAFGQSTTSRAAVVLRLPEEGAAEGLRVILSPVAYIGEANLEQQLWNVIKNINDNHDYLATVGSDRLKQLLLFTLANGVVSIKHVGFHEEKEWRLIYYPRLNSSKLITSSTEILAGVPQIVHKIPLIDNPDEGVTGVSITSLVDRIIIGPTVFGMPIYTAFVEELAKAGMTDAGSRVWVSGIPIRS
jgi:hypothetical protein